MRVGITMPPLSPTGPVDRDRRRHGQHLGAALQNLAMVECVHPVEVDGVAGEGALTPAAALDALDLVIEIAPLLTEEWLSCFRARGGRSVLHPCGTVHAELIAASVFNQAASALPPGRHDAIWLMPGEAAYAPMLRALHRIPVSTVPRLWAPPVEPVRYDHGSLSRRGAHVAIVAPAACALDMGAIPFLIADSAARQRPEAVVHAQFVNAAPMAAQWSFATMVRSSDLAARQAVAIDAGDDVRSVLGQGANLLVAYHAAGDADFACLDALAGGFPVVHNATALSGIGYGYDGQDIAGGATALLRAVGDHDARCDQARQTVATRLASLHPHDPGNRDIYARALLVLGGASRMAA